MIETTTPQAGQEMKYEIGGKTLHLVPMPIGRLKMSMKILAEGDPNDYMATIAAYLVAVFDPAEHEFLNKEWIDNNVSMPQANKILADVGAVNGLPNFFQQAKPATETTEIRDLTEKTTPTQPTPAGSATSITPSA